MFPRNGIYFIEEISLETLHARSGETRQLSTHRPGRPDLFDSRETTMYSKKYRDKVLSREEQTVTMTPKVDDKRCLPYCLPGNCIRPCN